MLHYAQSYFFSTMGRYNRDFVHAYDCMNEAVQLLENQGDMLSCALALKYASLFPAFFSYVLCRLAGICAPSVRAGKTGLASVTPPRLHFLFISH